MTYLITRIPFLSLGPVNSLLALFLTKLIGIILDQTELSLFIGYIDIRTNKQGNDFIQAAINNQKIQQSGSVEEKKKAEEELIEKFRLFARFSA